jgi:hypothetical protein
MVLTSLGLALSAAFAGAALYINWSEQPARLALDDRALLQEWKPSYSKGFAMQASLALVAGGLGIGAYYFEHSMAAGIAGALMLLNWPFTLVFIMPTNKRLGATPDGDAGPETRADRQMGPPARGAHGAGDRGRGGVRDRPYRRRKRMTLVRNASSVSSWAKPASSNRDTKSVAR